jgi:hypothetical protein
MSSRRDREHVQPVEQVLAELSGGHPLLQVLVGGRDDPCVHRDRARAAEALDRPLLEHAQQLGLHLGGQVPDLVEEDRRVIGQLETADLARERVGEGPFFAPEQLALDQRGGDRGAVHAHHRASAPPARVVNLQGEQFFPGAGFPKQQHRGIGRGHLLDLFHHGANRRTPADHLDRSIAIPVARVELRVTALVEAFHLRDRGARRRVALLTPERLAEQAGQEPELAKVLVGPGPLAPDGTERQRARQPPPGGERHDDGRRNPRCLEGVAIGLAGNVVDARERHHLPREQPSERPGNPLAGRTGVQPRPGRHAPGKELLEPCLRVQPPDRGVVDLERIGQARKGGGDRVGRRLRRKGNEPSRHILDEPLERRVGITFRSLHRGG